MLVHLKQNGFGLRYGAHFDGEPQSYEPWFDSADDYLNRLREVGTLVLGGQPGAGKSHITEDILMTAIRDGHPAAMLSLHINSSSEAGRDWTTATLQTAQDLGEADVTVLDNLDFLVYTGGKKRRRSDRKVEAYFDFAEPLIRGCMEAGNSVLATVHTEQWRDNHSQAPAELRERYDTLIKDMGGEVDFSGQISWLNAESLLVRRGIAPKLSASIADALEANDGLLFRQAHHIDPATFTTHGITVAMHAVDYLKELKIAGGA